MTTLYRPGTMYVRVTVEATEDGDPDVDPTDFPVDLGFARIDDVTGEDGGAEAATWAAGAWVPGAARPTARALVGADGLDLAAGGYRVYAQVTGPAPEKPIIRAERPGVLAVK